MKKKFLKKLKKYIMNGRKIQKSVKKKEKKRSMAFAVSNNVWTKTEHQNTKKQKEEKRNSY